MFNTLSTMNMASKGLLGKGFFFERYRNHGKGEH